MQTLGKIMGLILENGCAIEKILAPNLSPGGLISEKNPKFKPLGLKFRGGLFSANSGTLLIMEQVFCTVTTYPD